MRKAIVALLGWTLCASVWALPPTVQDDVFSTDEDVAVSGNVLSNDTPDGPYSLTVVTRTPPAIGSLSGPSSTGDFTYSPPPNFSGEVVFTYVVRENDPVCLLLTPPPGCTVTGNVTLEVRAVADLPIISTGSPVFAPEDAPSIPLGIGLSLFDTDGSQTLSALVTVPTGATLSAGSDMGGGVWDVAIGDLPGLALTPPPNVNGAGSIDLAVRVADRAFDGGGVLINEDIDTANASISITLTPVNDPPQVVGAPPAVITDEDVNASVSMAGVFDDVDIATNGDTLIYDVTGISNSAIDTATMSGSTLNIVLVPDAFGGGDVDVTVQDSGGLTATVTVPVTVNSVNDTPYVADAVPSISTPEDTNRTENIGGLFDDVDGDPLTLTAATSHPAIASATMAGSDLQIVVLPDANGTGTVEVTATDPSGAFVSVSIPVEVTAENDQPFVAGAIPSVTTDEDVNTSVSLADVFDDVDILTNSDVLTLSVTGVGNAAIDSATMTGTSLNIVLLPDQFGSGDVRVTATDLGGMSEDVLVPVTVNPVNDAPYIAGAVPAVVTTEDVSTTVSMAGVFDDVDGDALTLSAAASHPAIASVSMTGTTLNIFVLADANGAGTVDVTATDPSGESVTATVNVDITPDNDAPFVAGAIPSLSTDEDVNASVSLAGLFDDVDISSNGDSLTLTVSSVNNGAIDTASIVGDNLEIVLLADQNGSGDVDVTATDTAGASVTVTIPVTVVPVNDAPVVAGVVPSLVTDEEVGISVDLAALFSDVDVATNGDALGLAVTGVSHSAVATASMSGTVLNITLLPDQIGSGSIDVTATDSGVPALGVSASISLDVINVNDAPVVVGSVAPVVVDEDAANTVLDLSGLFDDIDITTAGDSLALAVTSTTGSIFAAAGISGNALTIDYAPDQNGAGSVTVVASDSGAPALTAAYVISVSVNAINDAPQIAGPVPSLVTNEDVGASLDLNGLFTDVDIATNGDSLSLAVTGNTNAAVTSASISGGILSITLAPHANGTGAIEVTATDSGAPALSVAASISVVVNAVNDLPFVSGSLIPVAVAEDSADVNVSLVGLFDDVDIVSNGDSLSLAVSNVSVPGLLSASVVGSDLVLSFAANQNGMANVTITASDSAVPAGTVDYVLGVTVNAVNDPPVASGTIADQTMMEDDPPLTFPVDVFTDVDVLTNGDTISLSIVNVTTPQLFNSMSITNGQMTVGLRPNRNGDADVTVRATDGAGAFVEQTFTITVIPVNDLPFAAADSATVAEDSGAIVLPVLVNDFLAEEPTMITAVSVTGEHTIIDVEGNEVPTPNGTVIFTGTDVTYTPTPNFNGVDTFTYTITDVDGDTAVGVVNITVTGVNDPPFLASAGIDAYPMVENTTLDVNTANGVLREAWDVDGAVLDAFGNPVGNSLVAQIETLPSLGSLVLNADGSFSYTPPLGFLGSVTFTFRIFDNMAQSAPIPVTIDVLAGGTPPPPPPPGEVATPFNIAQVPLEQAISVPPNVLVVMDTSGSMDWHLIVAGADENGGMLLSNAGFTSGRVNEQSYVYLYDLGSFNTYPGTSSFGHILPDQASLDAHNLASFGVGLTVDADGDGTMDFGPLEVWKARSSEYNKIYYNPATRYEPWTGQDRRNDDFTDANISGLAPIRLDPVDPSRTFNLLAPHSYTARDVPELDANGGTSTIAVNNLYLPYYYTATGEKVVITTDPARPGYRAAYPGGQDRRDCSLANGQCTPAEELQNFANWFQYYRSREFVTKGSIGGVISNLRDIRIGYETIDNTTTVPVRDMNDLYSEGDKKALLDNVYAVDSFGGTPLRQALGRAGQIFSCATGNDCPALPVPEGQCQQNFALLFTDGYWNGGAGVPDNADGDDDSPFDGVDSGPVGSRYGDSVSATLADVAMHYYETDLFPGVDDEVPVGIRDVQGAPAGYLDDEDFMHQHMKTYAIAFGVAGTPTVDPMTAQTWDVDTPFPWTDPFAGTFEKIDDLVHTAVNGRGAFYSAGNPRELRAAFEAAFLEFTQAASSASAAAFNSTSLREDTLLFRGFYDLRDRTGELTATLLDNDGQFVSVEWLASEELDTLSAPIANTRKIVTYNPATGTGVPFQYGNLAPQQQASLTPEQVDFLRGSNTYEIPNVPNGFLRDREDVGGLLGPIVNSSPVFVGTPRAINRDQAPFPTDDLYSSYVNGIQNRTPVVYVGANDGMLHGFVGTRGQANSGDEIFAYVPNKIIDANAHYANELNEFTSPFYFHNYYVDQSPRLNDVYMRATPAGAKQWLTALVGGLGAGGKGFFALNVNDPDGMFANEATAANAVLWEFTDDDDTYPVDAGGNPLADGNGDPLLDPNGDPVKDLGYATSLPFIQLSNATDNGSPARHEWVAAFGNGMNSTSGIAKLFVLFMDRGVDGWQPGDFVKIDTGYGVPLPGEQLEGYPNGLGAPTAVDADLNGTVDFAYAGDRLGNLFRFDMTNANPNNWHAVRLFTATYNDGTQDVRQPILSRPLVIKHPERRGFVVIFGTGSYVTTEDARDTEIQSVYGIWDELVSNPATAAADTKDLRLVEQVMTNVVDDALSPAVTRRIMTRNAVSYTAESAAPGTYGWYFDLDMQRATTTVSGQANTDTSGQAPPDPQFPGERAIRRMVFRNGSVITTTVIPATNETSCLGARAGAILVFDALSGGDARAPIIDFNTDGVVDQRDLIDLGGDSFSGGLLFNQSDIDGTLVDLSTLGGEGDVDFLFVSGGNDTTVYRIADIDGGRTGRLSWVELDDSDQ